MTGEKGQGEPRTPRRCRRRAPRSAVSERNWVQLGIGGPILAAATWATVMSVVAAAPSAMSVAGAPGAEEGSGAARGPAVPATQPQNPDRLDPLAVAPAVTGGRGSRLPTPKGRVAVAADGTGELDLPAAALEAYQRAERILARAAPGCRLSWTLLAGVGRAESDHGRYGGAVLGSDGVSRPRILGVPLDGTGGTARVHDTDAGELDQDRVWDRAVGPMQFLPGTWSVTGVDGDGDGVRSPDDIDDASLAAGVYLCAGTAGLDVPVNVRAALLRYNHSEAYAELVMSYERDYRGGRYSVRWPGDPTSGPAPVATAVVREARGAMGGGSRRPVIAAEPVKRPSSKPGGGIRHSQGRVDPPHQAEKKGPRAVKVPTQPLEPGGPTTAAASAQGELPSPITPSPTPSLVSEVDSAADQAPVAESSAAGPAIEEACAVPTAEPGVVLNAEPGVVLNAEPGAEPGAEPAAEPGAVLNAEQCVVPAAEPGVVLSAEPGVEPGVEAIAEPGVVPVAEPGVVR